MQAHARSVFVGSALLVTVLCTAQNPVWSPDVANIVYTHCTGCHHPGTAAPFDLMSYQDAVTNSIAMSEAVVLGHMPPWPADPDYRHFASENILTQGQIDAVANWVLQGTPFGDPLLEPDPPAFPSGGSMLSTIDHVVAVPPYTLQSDLDEYRWFAIPTNFPDTVYVNAIEVLPGIDDVVHHVDISFDMTGNTMAYDLQDPLPGFNGSTGQPTYTFYMNAWQPGGDIVRYPQDWGIAVPPGADFVLEIHYGPYHQGEVDSTLLNLQFVTNASDVRPVRVGWLLSQSPPGLVDGPFVLPANTISTFHQEYTVPNDRSFISICPHMHQLGRSYKVWYEHQGDSIPLIDIPWWDFHWQRYYTFQYVQPIPAGAVIKSEGVYDNTVGNANNPNNPPQNVYLGSTTEDEMFLCYFIWANYQAGDEDVLMDSSLVASVPSPAAPLAELSVFPNPAQQEVVVEGLDPRAVVSVVDAEGRTVEVPRLGNRFDVRQLPNGLYAARTDQRSFRFVVHH